MRFSTNTTLVLAFAAAISLVGCGDDDGGGTGGTAGSAGTGGMSGTGGTGGTSGTAGTTSMCGTVTCDALPDGISLPVPGLPSPEHCCTPGDNLCGIASDGLLVAGTCLEQNAEGAPSAECDDESLAFPNPLDPTTTFDIPLAGCCRPDGACGLSSVLMVPILGMLDLGTGCTERAKLAASLDSSGLGEAPAWTSTSCTYGNNTMDAGTEDAGE